MSGTTDLYIFTSLFPRSPLKIGISKNARARLRQVNSTACPYYMFLYHFYRFPCRKWASAVENKIHQKLSSYQTAREWFDIDKDDVINLIDNELGIFDPVIDAPKLGIGYGGES